MKILAINPWIYDFAAYDYWIKPYGFLQILEVLRQNGLKIDFVDTLDRYNPEVKNIYLHEKNYGMGKFYTQKVQKPKDIDWVPRKYKRYGMPIKIFEKLIKNKQPDIILITSGMTYWYPGVIKSIKICKKYFSKIPIFLGGTYASLCYKHAKQTTGADYIIKSNQLDIFGNIIKKMTNVSININYNSLKNIFPNYSHYYSYTPYAVVKSSWGCPFNCLYCASAKLSPKKIIFAEPEKIVNYILSLYNQGINHFVFYDDALLYNQKNISDILKMVLDKKIKISFHTPNGLHAKFLNENIACLMKKTNFINPRISLETMDSNLKKLSNNKVSISEFKKAILNLKKAGYKKGTYSAYLLLGIPGENLKQIEKTLYQIHKLGAYIYLTEFSPVPQTKMWENLNLNNKKEPLLQNNTIYPIYNFNDWGKLQRLKDLSQKLNNKL